ncbi:hypothetical protein BASA60_010167 [Batrachochytrium salamandrivorans]|nr:hypothetical protein BASA60_010167 [Batrachochytrium salamandrivorans]
MWRGAKAIRVPGKQCFAAPINTGALPTSIFLRPPACGSKALAIHVRHSSLVFPQSMKVTTAQKELDTEVTSDDIDALYNALRTPVAAPLGSGPAASVALKLSPEYLQRLSMKFSDVEGEQSLKRTGQRDVLEKKLSLLDKTPTLNQITELIHVNSITKRPKEALAAFNHIGELGLTPDVVAYNHLLDAYSRVGDLDAAVAVFSQMQASDTPPDLVSYSTLINTCVEKRNINAAFKLYQDMKKQGLHPNQIVFTTLIKGCVKANDVARAWSTFNYMRTEISLPDAVSFNLMIHVCSKTQDAERAMDLFKEMADRGLEVSHFTLSSLIQACVSRQDYYGEAFVLLERMASQGFLPNMHTYNIILSGAAKYGDVLRGRLIWNDMVERMREAPLSSDPKTVHLGRIAPDEFTFASMLRLYARALKIHSRSNPSSASATVLKRDSPEKTPPTAIVAETKESISTKSVKSSKLTKSPKNPRTAAEAALPMLMSTEVSPDDLLSDANHLWNVFQKQTHLHNTHVTSLVHGAYLTLLSNDPAPDAFTRALSFWDSLDPSTRRSVSTFRTMIELAMRQSDTVDHGMTLWKEMLEWDASIEASYDDRSDGRLTRSEKERLRAEDRRTREIMLKMHIIIANGYSKAGNQKLAVKMLYDSILFRYPYYLPAIHFRDIPDITRVAQRNADNGDWSLMEDVLTLCPPLTDPLTQIQHMLKLKTVPTGDWWGWRVIGVDKHDMQILRRAQDKERAKISQRTEAYRNRTQRHYPGSTGPVNRSNPFWGVIDKVCNVIITQIFWVCGLYK